jgi:glycosyltransferase involved in cell wall biosynthesis
MRIGINTLAYLPWHSGGDGTYVRELTAALARRDDDNEYILFVSPWNSSSLPQQSAKVRQVMCPLPGQSFTLRIGFEQSVLPVLVQRERLDLLHCPVNVSPLAGRTPLVLTLLEAEPFMWPEDLPFAQARYWRTMRRLSARKARVCLAISDAARDELETHMGVPPAKLVVAHLGIDHSRFRTGTGNRPDIPAEAAAAGYVLWIGRSYPRKNLRRMILAFDSVKKRGFPQKLLLAGTKGWEDQAIITLVSELGLTGEVIWLGRVPGDQLPALYSAADLFAFPSLHEAFGLPIVEAMACGTPVLTSDRGAMREIAGDAAALVNPESVESIAGAMEQVLADKELRARLHLTGPERAARFDWRITAERTVRVYAEIAKRLG